MAFGVTRVEVQGWLNLIVAIVGLYFTATNGGATLDAIAKLGAAGSLPAEFAGGQGAVRVFVFLLMLVVFGSMLFVGLAIMLGQLFRQMGAQGPHRAAFTLIGAMIMLTAALTMGMFGQLLWVAPALFTLVLLVGAGMAAVEINHVANPESGFGYWFVICGGGAASVVVTGIIFMAAYVPEHNRTVEASNAAHQAAGSS